MAVIAALLGCGMAVALVAALAVVKPRWRRELRSPPLSFRELRGARLVYVERLFRSAKPSLVARIDRGYAKRGRIWLLELKTRGEARVYASDVIELSAQKVVVEAETGQRVSEEGFVLTQSPAGSRRLHRVALISAAAVEALVRRRAAILDGAQQPRFAQDQRLCAHCAYRPVCGRRGLRDRRH